MLLFVFLHAGAIRCRRPKRLCEGMETEEPAVALHRSNKFEIFHPGNYECSPESAEKMVAKDVFIHHEAQGTFRENQVHFVPMKNPELNP
jgi:cold shock CspA family protein